MKKILTLLITGLLFFMVVPQTQAKQIDTELAETIARNFYKEAVIRNNAFINVDAAVFNVVEKPESVLKGKKNNLYYVFAVNETNGFVIVSADDRVIPVLGYALEGTYDTENKAITFRKWMDDYGKQIKLAIVNDLQPSKIVSDTWNKYLVAELDFSKAGSVDPLLTTKWDQAPYYNDYCPSNWFGQKAVVGCVATAMAQIMKYHDHPPQGTGFHSYNHPQFGTVSANFGSATYDWNSMPNKVTSANEAVALLSYHCGVSIDMGYGVDVSGISSLSPVSSALKKYFFYDNSANFVDRKNYSDSQWKNLMKGELDNSRPVEYGGIGPQGGHAFVADGYDDNDFIHFNWGWSGNHDGYFHIDNLNPPVGGIGSGGGNFNYNHQAVVGIKPAGAGGGGNPNTSPVPTDLELYAQMSVTSNPLEFNKPFELSVDIANFGDDDINGEFAAMLFDEEGQFMGIIDSESGVMESGFYYSFVFETDGLITSPGTYSIGIYFKTANVDWTLVPEGEYFNPGYIDIIGPSNDIKMYADVQLSPLPVLIEKPFTITTDFGNYGNTDFSGYFSADLYLPDGTYVKELEVVQSDLCSQCHFDGGVTFQVPALNIEPGSYLIIFWNSWDGDNWSIIEAGDHKNPVKIQIVSPDLDPDPYEVNNVSANAYSYTPTYDGQDKGQFLSTDANMHNADDLDYYKINLDIYADYKIKARVHDSYSTGNGLNYTNDVLFAYKINGGEWSEIYDDVMPEEVFVEGGGEIIFGVSSYYVGTLGTYLLDVQLSKYNVTGIDGLREWKDISLYPNPVQNTLYIDYGQELNPANTSIHIFNTAGQAIKVWNNAGILRELDIQDLNSGMYIVEIKSKDVFSRQKINVIK